MVRIVDPRLLLSLRQKQRNKDALGQPADRNVSPRNLRTPSADRGGYATPEQTDGTSNFATQQGQLMSEIAEERRYEILKALIDLNERKLNSRIMQKVIAARGIPGTQADIEEDYRFLQSAKCVVLETLGTFVVAQLLARGEEVADGALRIAGVMRAPARG